MSVRKIFRVRIWFPIGIVLCGCVNTAPPVEVAASASNTIAEAKVDENNSAMSTAPETYKIGETHHDDNPRPFDETRNAMADVEAAMSAATLSGKNILIALGGNWCHDSRGLAAKFEKPELARVIENGYELVWVDVGRRDRNLDVARRFGVFELIGTPTILIVSPSGELLNGGSVHDWRTADSKPYDETLDYFRGYASAHEKTHSG